MRKIDKIIVHHSAGTDHPGVDFFNIYNWHVGHNKWSDVAYHHIIEEVNGKPIIVVGRPITKVGAHAKGANTGSIGICVVGVEHFSTATLVKLASIVDQLREVFSLSRLAVYGHCETGTTKTECPGEWLMKWIRNYRHEGVT